MIIHYGKSIQDLSKSMPPTSGCDKRYFISKRNQIDVLNKLDLYMQKKSLLDFLLQDISPLEKKRELKTDFPILHLMSGGLYKDWEADIF